MFGKFVNKDTFQHYAYGNNPINCFENQEQKANLEFLLNMKLLLRIPDSHHMFPAARTDKNLNSEILNDMTFSRNIVIVFLQR